MAPQLEKVLMEVKADQERKESEYGELYHNSGYVVTTTQGEMINPSYLSHAFTKLARENGLTHITLHGLRHSVASIELDAGVSLYDTSRLLGHSSSSTTSNIYAHQIDGTNSGAIKKLSDALGNSNS